MIQPKLKRDNTVSVRDRHSDYSYQSG